MAMPSPPALLEDITVPWLNEALEPHLARDGVTVATCSVEPVGDSSGGSGLYGMVEIEYDDSATSLPTRLFAKILRHSEHVPFPAEQYRTEIAFYRHLGNESGVRVPEMLYGGFDRASGKAGMLIEDMSAYRAGVAKRLVGRAGIGRTLPSM